MKLRVIQEFFYEVDPAWYNNIIHLNDKDKTLEQKIIDFELQEVHEGIIDWSNLEMGETKVEIVKEDNSK